MTIHLSCCTHNLQEELEKEIERLKQKLVENTIDLPESSVGGQHPGSPRGTCELSEPENCGGPLARGPGSTDVNIDNSFISDEPYCEDCELYGHSVEDCPHFLDVY